MKARSEEEFKEELNLIKVLVKQAGETKKMEIKRKENAVLIFQLKTTRKPTMFAISGKKIRTSAKQFRL
jgi:uncharacterized protein YihD (DUF1040 family)